MSDGGMRISPQDIVQGLLNDRSLRFEKSGDFLREGVCPGCGQRTLYVPTNHPYILRCNRANKCGYEESVRSALPELFERFIEKHPPTEANPQATADAYLCFDRGFDLSKIHGWYEQGFYQTGPRTGLPTVRFYLDAAKTRYWERLIGGLSPKGAKAMFGGKRKADNTLYQGDVWAPPLFHLERGETCYLVEGIFHAIALFHAGYKAVATLSSTHYPANFIETYANKAIRWTWALDNDNAGKSAMQAHHARLKKAGQLSGVCLPPEGKDWDDLWREGKITPEALKKGRYHGRLFLAETVEEKAYYHYLHNRYTSFILDFKNALYQVDVPGAFIVELGIALNGQADEEAREAEEAPKPKKKKGKEKTDPTAQPEVAPAPSPEAEAAPEPTEQGEAETQAETPPAHEPKPAPEPRKLEVESPSEAAFSPFEEVLKSTKGQEIFKLHCQVDQISNVRPQFLYMTRDIIMDKREYVFSIDYANNQPQDIIAMTGNDITDPGAFHKALLNRTAGGTFDGAPRHLKNLRERWLDRIITVSSIPFVGYEDGCEAYIFQNHAWHKGKRIPLNKHGYFEIKRRGIKTSLNSVSINTNGKFDPAWLPNFLKAYHYQGLVALGFWLGSLFVQQIRGLHGSFPFLEFTGEPGAGKSTLLEFLWALVGRDNYEGFDVLKTTVAGRRRTFSQVSNLPLVIIESDRDNGEKDAKQKQFGFDEVKTFYNGRSTGTLGVATRSNDVDDQPFQGSLVISQNAEVDGSEALLSRIVHCHADKRHHTPQSREISRWFERQTSETVGGFLHEALSRERQFLERFQQSFEAHEKAYTESLKHLRVIKNHAQIAACVHALDVVFPNLEQETKEAASLYLEGRAKQRQARLASDHPLVEQFWDTYDYLNGKIFSGFKEQKWDALRDEEPLNHSGTPGFIAISFPEILEQCRAYGQPAPDIVHLKKLLGTSQKRKLVETNKCVRSAKTRQNLKCWVFKK